MKVVSPSVGRGRSDRKPSGQEAITRYRVLERAGARAILELSPETGRTHQLRVQVAAAGGAIAGDHLYGQQPAHRLMLHAARLELRHPVSGAPLEVQAPLPPDLSRWLSNPTPWSGTDIFEGRLHEAIQARWALGLELHRFAAGQGVQ
jgi:23S rRNA (cytosine1962-C5)-methyltransferase